MEKKVSQIKKLLVDDIALCNILLGEEEATDTYQFIQNLRRNSVSRNYSFFANINTYDLFLAYFFFNNDTMALMYEGKITTYNQSVSYEELNNVCEESKDLINSWDFEKIYECLHEIIKTYQSSPLDQYKLIGLLQDIGLPSPMFEYDLSQVIIAVQNLLCYKFNYKKVIASQERQSVKKEKLAYIYKQLLANTINMIIERCESTKKFYSERSETLSNRLAADRELSESLEVGRLQKEILIEPEWHLYLEPKILELIYQILLSNLKNTHQKSDDTNKELKAKIAKTPITNFLYSNGFDPNTIDSNKIKQLEQIEFKFLKDIIDFFIQLGYTIDSLLLSKFNLLLISQEDLEYLKLLINSSAITVFTLKTNIFTLLEQKERILINYEFLKEHIDFNNNFYNDSILLEDIHLIKNKIKILSSYNLTKNNFMFLLTNFDYLSVYDLMLEQEIPLYLFMSICKTQDPILTIKKIMISKEIGESYQNKAHQLMSSIVVPESFICKDEDIDLYIQNNVQDYLPMDIIPSPIVDIEESNIVKKLDEYHREKDMYHFEDVIISRTKVLRNLQTFKNNNVDLNRVLLSCIIANSILSDSQINIIRQVIQSYKNEKSIS